MEFVQSTVKFNDKEVKVWHLLMAFLIMGAFGALCVWGLGASLGYLASFGFSKGMHIFLNVLIRAIFFAITHSINTTIASHTWGDNMGTFDLFFA